MGFDSFDPYYPEEQKLRNMANRSGEVRGLCARAGRTSRDPVKIGPSGLRGRVISMPSSTWLRSPGVRPSLERPAAYADVNVERHLAAARSRGPRRACRISCLPRRPRCTVSAKTGPSARSDPVERPISPYAATKRAGELVAHSFHHAHGHVASPARGSSPPTGRDSVPTWRSGKFAERMLKGEVLPIYGDGSALRDFTFIDDLVDGLIRALDRDLGFRIVNLGAGRSVVLRDVIRELERPWDM